MRAWLDRPASTDSVAGLLLQADFCPPVLGNTVPSAEVSETVRIGADASECQLSIIRSPIRFDPTV